MTKEAFMTAKALIIAGYGLNCEEESAFAFEQVGMDAAIMHVNDLIEKPNALSNYQTLLIPCLLYTSPSPRDS